MIVPIKPVEADGKTCAVANVSVAASATLALRAVPVDGDGGEHPDAAIAVVGTTDQADVAAFLTTVAEAAAELLAGRGF